MQLSGINPGDIVYCDVRGDRFYAFAAGRDTKETTNSPTSLAHPLRIEGMGNRPIPRMRVKASEVVGHWRKSKRSKV